MKKEHTNRCKSCGAIQASRFCPECGEERLTSDLRSANYIIKQFITELTDVNGKLWLTAKTLFFRPGVIDRDYATGRRRIYLKPITLFLLINVVFVMFATLSDFFVNFYSQYQLQIYSELMQPWLDKSILDSGWTVEEFAQRYDQVVKVIARSLIIVQVPFFALFVMLICYQRNLYSGDYITFALNYHSFLLVMMLVSAYVDTLFYWINHTQLLPFQFSNIIWIVLYGSVFCYLVFALRNMFHFNWWHIVWRLPILVVAYYLSHFIYRFIQLLITISLIEQSV